MTESLENRSDEELVDLSLKASSNFGYLVKRYETKLIRYIRRLCNCSEEDIEDLLQEIFIKVYRNLNDFDQGLKFSSWLYRIAHNETINHFWKTKARPKNVELVPEMPLVDSKADNFVNHTNNHLDNLKIQEVLASLPLKYREVLVLRYFEEKEYEEISDILKKPSGTVATLLNRAKKQFKNESEKRNIEFVL